MSRRDLARVNAMLNILQRFWMFLIVAFGTLILVPNFLPNWHIRAIGYQLDRIWRGEITRLIINLPPRYLKSIIVSVAFPAFLLGHEPWRRIIAISYSDELAAKHARDFRSIVEFGLVPACLSEHAYCAQHRGRVDHNAPRLSQSDVGFRNTDRTRWRSGHY